MKKLRLYVIGETPRSAKAIADLKTILEDEFKDHYALEVVDIFKNPQLAEDDKILATPTVIRIFPSPIRKIVGDLSDREKILLGLDLIEEEKI